MPGPTIRRRQLGIELGRLRDAAGVNRQEAANALGCSPARIGHIESGRNVLSKAELIVLLRDHYGADAALPPLEELRQEASKRGWWSQYGLPEWLAGYVGLETDATSVRCVELELIPGLLQTEQYARKLYTLRGQLSAKETERRVAARMQRQERLSGLNPLQLTAVVSQAALERCARDEAAAAAQLAQLLDRAAWSTIELRVLPFDLGLHVGMAGPFSILSFPDHLLADAAYQEYAVGGHVIDDESIVAQLDTLFSELLGQALDDDESLAMIAEFAKHTHRTGRREASVRDDLAPAAWRKSTYSNDQGACVEVTDLDDGARAVRDGKNPTGPALMFAAAEWVAFTAGVRAGEFD